MWSTKYVLLLLLGLIGYHLSAQKDSTRVFDGKLEMAANRSSGNVDIFGMNLGLDLQYQHQQKKWEFEADYQTFYSRGNKVNENFLTSLIHISPLGSKSNYYLKSSIHRNIFRGFAFQWKSGGGYLHDFLDKKKASISSRLGYQLRYNLVDAEVVDEFQGGYHHFGQLGTRFEFPIMKNITAKIQTDYEFDIDRLQNFYFDVLGSVRMKVNEVVSIRVDYTYVYAGIPVVGRLPKDQQIRGTLVFNIM